MSEVPFAEHNFQPTAPSRRVVLLGLTTLAAEAALIGRWQIAQYAGEFTDMLLSPESISPQAIPVLTPRENDTPVVSPITSREAIAIPLMYSANNHAVDLHFNSAHSWRAEHTGNIIKQGLLQAAGKAIITTAEGLVEGNQEYCALFRDEEQALAVGYRGGLYAYQSQLGEGEWVRIVTDKDNSPARTSTSWERLEDTSPTTMLIEDIVQGAETLNSLGYKPWSAVLPSTLMPESINPHKTLRPEDCAQSIREALSDEKRYFVSENGDLCDLYHIGGYAGETLSLFSQLYYQLLTGEHRPVYVGLGPGRNARFEVAIDPRSIMPETIIDATFQIMSDLSMRMEGIGERMVIEKLHVDSVLPRTGGDLHPEDLFSNSLGIMSMLALIRGKRLDKRLEYPFQALQRSLDTPSTEAFASALEAIIAPLKHAFGKRTIAHAVEQQGVRKLERPITTELPLGLSHFVSTKVTDNDASTLTHIDLRGIKPNNPAVRYRMNHVPAAQIAFEYGLQKVENAIKAGTE